MIGYVTLGSKDLPRALKFYDALLGEMGAKRTMEFDSFTLYGNKPGAPGLAICKPYDGNPASVGNGVMVALSAGSRENVDRLYKKAIELGATDEGKPGERVPKFYAAYFRDLDGNKLNFFHFG